eukprot:758910-Hanusia_phi.AAC.1
MKEAAAPTRRQMTERQQSGGSDVEEQNSRMRRTCGHPELQRWTRPRRQAWTRSARQAWGR